ALHPPGRGVPFLMRIPPPLRSTLFPYTTLFRSFPADSFDLVVTSGVLEYLPLGAGLSELARVLAPGGHLLFLPVRPSTRASSDRDRKSTRLNSSHVAISYAVFCLKKKRRPTFAC